MASALDPLLKVPQQHHAGLGQALRRDRIEPSVQPILGRRPFGGHGLEFFQQGQLPVAQPSSPLGRASAGKASS
jgi:hypothetical protein